MKILKRHYYILTISTIILLVSFAGVFLFAKGMFEKYNKVRTINDELATYRVNKEVFKQETIQMKDLMERTKRLEGSLVTTTTLPSLLSSIEELAKKEGLDFTITSAQNPGDIGAEKLIISFSANGQLKSVDSFLDKMARQLYQINFTKLYLFSENDASKMSGSSSISKVINNKSNTMWEVIGTIEVISFAI